MCLSIGTHKTITFPFGTNGKFIGTNGKFIVFLGVPKYSLIIMCLNIGTPNNHHFPFGTNGKVVVLGVPVLKHFRVYRIYPKYSDTLNVRTRYFFLKRHLFYVPYISGHVPNRVFLLSINVRTKKKQVPYFS